MAEQLEVPESDSHHSSGSLQPSVIPVPGDPMASSSPQCQALIWHTDTCRQKTLTHKINLKLIPGIYT